MQKCAKKSLQILDRSKKKVLKLHTYLFIEPNMLSSFDRIYRSVLLTKFFTEGWGTPSKLQKLMEFRSSVVSKVVKMSQIVDPSHPVELKKEVTRDEKNNVVLIEGRMRSPFALLFPDLVENPVETAAFELVLPIKWQSEELKPMCINLAGTGDHYFWRRRKFMAYPLAKEHSVASIILENPFYGVRKPKKQLRSSLRNVTDLFVMGGSLILECNALLNWCERKGFGPLCLTGISMGGYMASLAASMWPKPVSLVPCLSGSTASAVFTEGVMSGAIPWNLLRKQLSTDDFHYYKDLLSKRIGEWKGEDPSREDALLLMQEIMDEFTHVANYPVPVDTALIIAVFADLDAYVPKRRVTELKEIWPQVEIRQIHNKGHIHAVLSDQKLFRHAILTSLQRNADKYYQSNPLPSFQLHV